MIQEPEPKQQTEPRGSARTNVSLAKILVATDFSEMSDRALEQALSLARDYNSRIFLAHILPLDVQRVPEITEVSRGKMRRLAQEGMERIVASNRLLSVPHEQIIEAGPLWPSIEALIKKHGIDLIVVGTHGKSLVHKILIGSSAEEIFRQARIPVLTVGPAAWREPLYGVKFKNILFATAFGVGAEREAAYAFSLAQEHHSRLTLLHVQQRPDEEQAIVHQLQELVPAGVDLHCLPLFRVEQGDPVNEIFRVAEDTQADLIVIGAKSRKGLAGHMPHTTAYRVVCRASCPVLTIKS